MSELVDGGPPEGSHLRAMTTLGREIGSGLWEQANVDKMVAALFPPEGNKWGEEFRAGALVIATDAIIVRSCPVVARSADLHRLIDPIPMIWDGWFELVSRALARESERFAKVENWRIERSRAAMLVRRGVLEVAGKVPSEEIERLTRLISQEVSFLPDAMVKGGAAFVCQRGVLRFLQAEKATRSRREVALCSLADALNGSVRESFNKALDRVLAPA